MHGGAFQKGEPHKSHGEKDGESGHQSWRSFWIAQEVTKSWGLSLRNEWLIIRWLVIHFCPRSPSYFIDFFIFIFIFLQIDPKVAFPRRAQPKVSRRAMDGMLARLSNRALAAAGGWGLCLQGVSRGRWKAQVSISVRWPCTSKSACQCGFQASSWEEGQMWSFAGGRGTTCRNIYSECSVYSKARLRSH